MRRIGFRTRILIVLVLFAVVPSAILTGVYYWSVSYMLREVIGTDPWERAAQSGIAAMQVLDAQQLSPEDREKVREHREVLRASLINANRWRVWGDYAPAVFTVIAALTIILVIGVASARVGGHLSRQVSRPLQELVGWTELIARGEKLPDTGSGRGAAEFELLRQRMRLAARELGKSRERALEAERLRASRESARQVAHELKNRLMPMRFALSRLRRDSAPGMAEAIDVLDTETQQLEEIARSFSQFGKLPEGPIANVDIAEMISYAARAVLPAGVPVSIEVEDALPPVRGHHDALGRAFSNVLLNAVEASGSGKGIRVTAGRSRTNGGCVEIAISDEGHGIAPEELARIWEPYVTFKKGGTGLGLAITRQTVEAHGGTVEATSEIGRGTTVRFILPHGAATPVVAATIS
jgi:signal transduction histidine kinase